jgi:putative oxidoreductase
MTFLEKHTEQIYAATRIVVGFLFLAHGLQKLFGFFGGAPGAMPPALLYSAGGIELVGGLMVMVGFKAGWAAFISSGTMAVAYFMVHQKMGLLPIQNHGELSVLYTWVFLFIAAKGSGQWSLDATLAKS